MSTNELAASFRTLRGEICNLTEVRGLGVLETSKGLDIVKVAESFSEQSVKLNRLVADLVERISHLEKKLDSGSIGSSSKGSSVHKLKDLKDVDLTDVCDGSILVYRKGKFVSETPEE